MSFFIYVLECCDRSLYTGVTNDLENRIRQHSEGRGSKYVRSRLPFRLVFSEEAETKSDALKRENVIKGMTRAEKLNMINKQIIPANQLCLL